MKARNKPRLLLALAVGAGVLGLYYYLGWEPSYAGRGLSAWLRDLQAEEIAKRPAAEDALRHIGPKAVPFLVRRLGHRNRGKESRLQEWQRKTLELLSKYAVARASPGRAADARHQALDALDALGPAGKDALPALERLLHEAPPDPRALYVVARIGEAGEPLLRRALTNDERLIRMEAAVCFEMMNTKSEALYPKSRTDENVNFDARLCQFNLKVMTAAAREYVRLHPEVAFPEHAGAVAPLPVLPGTPSPVETNSLRQKASENQFE